MGTSWHVLCDKRCQLVPSSNTCLVGYELTSLVVRVDITCGTSWHLLLVRVDMGTSWHGYELTWGELTWVRVDCHTLAVPNDAVCIFSYEYLSETNWAVKRIGESVRCADLTIRLAVKANSMSARRFVIGVTKVTDRCDIVVDGCCRVVFVNQIGRVSFTYHSAIHLILFDLEMSMAAANNISRWIYLTWWNPKYNMSTIRVISSLL